MNSFTSYKADAGGALGGVLKVSQSPWSEVFGEPRFTGNQKPYDVERRDTWVLPEAWTGQSVKVGQEVEFMAFTDENWYTTRCMPMRIVTHANGVTWSRTEYSAQMPTLVPELGVSRILSSAKIGNSASFDRRGLSFFMEHGFMHTEEGMRHYRNTLKQLALNILEFAKFDVVFTLLTSQNTNMEWEKKAGVYKGKRLAALFADVVWQWACLQKYKNAMVLLDTKVQEIMRRYRGRADMWILPPQVQNYLQVVPSERTDYSIAGPAGPARLDAPNALSRVGTCDAYYARSYDIDATGPVDILAAPAQIGEYVEFRDLERDTNYDDYVSKHRHGRIFDEDADSWYEVKAQWLLDECQRFDPKTGELRERSTVYNAHVDGLHAGKRDVFSFYNADTRAYEQVRLFGQMEEEYFPAADKANLAKTALAAVRRQYAQQNRDLDAIWGAGTDLVARIDAADDALATIAANARSPLAPPTNNSIAGYQSFRGMRALAAAASTAAAADKATAAAFAAAVTDVVAKLRVFFPGSYLLDARFASPWWTNATPEDTFFENAIARSRVPLFTSGASGAGASGADFARALAEQLATATARAGKTPGAEMPAEVALAGDDEAQRRIVTAYALLSGVGVPSRGAGAQTGAALGADWFNAVKNTINFPALATSTETADALVKRVLAEHGDKFKADSLNARLRALNESIAGDNESGFSPAGRSAGGARTQLLAGRATIRSIFEAVKAKQPLSVIPASPQNPDVPMSIAEMRRAAAQLEAAGEAMDDDYVDADAPASDAIPPFEGAIASELSTDVAHIPLVAAAAIGAEFGAGGGDGDDDEYADPRARRAPRSRATGLAVAEAATAPMKRAWRNVRRVVGGDRLLAAVAHVYDFTPVRKIAFERFIANNILLPLAFIVARPHMTYNMMTGIRCLGGEEMGAYLQQPGRFEIGDDADVQAHIASYTYKSKAVVFEPRHVFVARNIFSNGCLGGAGVRPFTDKYVPGGENNGRESVFVLAVPYASNEANGTPLSLTGRAEVNGKEFDIAQSGQDDYIGVEFYNALWGWRHFAQNSNSESYSALDNLSQRAYVNTLCFQGQAFFFDKQTQQFTLLRRGKGHWGDQVYAGCRRVRAGDLAEFDPERSRYANCTEV